MNCWKLWKVPLKTWKNGTKRRADEPRNKWQRKMGSGGLLEPRLAGGRSAMSKAPNPTHCECIGQVWRPWDMIFKIMTKSRSRRACQNEAKNLKFLQQPKRAWASPSWTRKPLRTSTGPSTGFSWYCQLHTKSGPKRHDFDVSGTWA